MDARMLDEYTVASAFTAKTASPRASMTFILSKAIDGYLYQEGYLTAINPHDASRRHSWQSYPSQGGLSGEELPAVAKLLAYGALAGGVTSHIIVVTGFTGELRKQHLLAKQT